MKFKFLTPILFCVFVSQYVIAQTNAEDPRKPDIVNFGPGIGFDYGGLGVNFMVYPQKNIGIFFGGGYALAGFGYNTGVKLRLSPDKGNVVNPFLTAMYGYNAAVVIANDAELSKLFYGPTLGVGIDIRPRKPSSKGYLSLALMVPLRNSDAQNYIDFLKTQYGTSFTNDLLPIEFSIGYKFILNSN
jgi:hypothetical protein